MSPSPNVKYGATQAPAMRPTRAAGTIAAVATVLALLLVSGFTQAVPAGPTDEGLAPLAAGATPSSGPPPPPRSAQWGAPTASVAPSAPAVPYAVAESTPATESDPTGPLGQGATDADPLAPAGIRIDHAPVPKKVYEGPGGTADLEFMCPEPPMGLPIDPMSAASQDVVVYGCPFRIYDALFSMGNGAIVLDHNDHREVMFTSLHGQASRGEPHDRSRSGGQVHTAFVSGDQGIRWSDEPPFTSDEPSSGALGSDNDVVVDSAGNAYIAYLYDLPTGAETWDSVIGLWKAGRPSGFDRESGGYRNAEWFIGRDPDNRIERVHLLDLPGFVPLKEIEGELNETAPPSGGEGYGNSTWVQDLENATDERVLAVWHERAYDWQTTVTGLSGWIDVAWTNTSGGNQWDRLELDQLIGPCSAGSNAVYWQAKAYVACVVEAGYTDRSNARIGDVDIWEIDVYDGTTSLVGFSGMSTRGEVLMAQSFPSDVDNTYVGLLTWEKSYAKDESLTRLKVNHGYRWFTDVLSAGQKFERPAQDMGIMLRQWGEGMDNVPLLDAHVTAFEMTDDTFQSLMVYQEFHDDPQDVPEPDPNADPTTPIRTRLTDYNKFFVAFNRCAGPVAAYQAELGHAVDQHNSQEYAFNPGVFNEVRDGLFKTRETNTGEELMYFAMGDYGAMQYGALAVYAIAADCSAPLIPPVFPVAAVPQALTVTQGVSALVASAFAVPAVAMVGYLLTVKRRQPSYVTAEDK